MAFGKQEQIVKFTFGRHAAFFSHPWKTSSRSHRVTKRFKHRRERQRVRLNIEAHPEYKRYNYWED
jgi:allophanate hydrolase subunit 2